MDGRNKFCPKKDEIRRKMPVFQGFQTHFGQNFVRTDIVPKLISGYLTVYTIYFNTSARELQLYNLIFFIFFNLQQLLKSVTILPHGNQVPTEG